MIERKKYLDYAKGLGILFIMLAHSIQYFQTMGPINNFVCSFHVPVFFVAAGFLAWVTKERTHSVNTVIRKRAVTLLIPYVVYSLFNSALKFTVLIVKHSITSEAIKDELVALLITGNGTVWFLLTLFCVEIIFLTIKKYKDSSLTVVSGLCLILPYLIYPILKNPFGIVIIRIIAGLGFYLLGFILCNKIENYSKKKKVFLFTMLWLGGMVSYKIVGSNYSFFDGKFGAPIQSLFTGVLLSTAIVIGCICIENYFSNSKVSGALEYFGKNSLVVMLIHPTILLFFTYPLAGKFWNMGGCQSVIVALVLFLIITVIEIPVIYVVNRWFGWTLGKIKRVR